jgi:hypothetical protein
VVYGARRADEAEEAAKDRVERCEDGEHGCGRDCRQHHTGNILTVDPKNKVDPLLFDILDQRPKTEERHAAENWEEDAVGHSERLVKLALFVIVVVIVKTQDTLLVHLLGEAPTCLHGRRSPERLVAPQDDGE